ncbi:uncharacterized protein [Elaeis guineensis]|uniref:uncharacterized protein n=1 Tax=Elaeis guineensis var. tenera TaxID=51953 RepID=UPI003C6DAF0A
MASSQKRKKWTEEEERSLIDKYAEMASDGSLARMRTREKKFKPIAAHVNAGHHAVDPVAYPFLWSWKDASTKVQNMRHQYLLVKQKLISALPSPSDGSHDPSSIIDWTDGVSHWPNFLRYKQVFGDAPLPAKPPEPPPPPPPPPPSAAVPSFAAAIDDGDLGLGLGFDCCGGEEVDEEGFDYEEVAAAAAVEAEAEAPPPPHPPPPPPLMQPARSRKRRRKRPERRRAWAALAAQLVRLREREARLEEREEERERERRERERMDEEVEEEREKEWEKARREAEEAARRRRDEERDWEERMEERRTEWRKRVEDILSQHRAEMEQIQARILHDQQSIIGQLLGILSPWVACPSVGGLSDGGAGLASHHQHPHHHQHHQPYHSHLMQGLHHMNGMVPGENRVGGDGQEDQFIVDG